jgi:hypothetical protein
MISPSKAISLLLIEFGSLSPNALRCLVLRRDGHRAGYGDQNNHAKPTPAAADVRKNQRRSLQSRMQFSAEVGHFGARAETDEREPAALEPLKMPPA